MPVGAVDTPAHVSNMLGVQQKKQQLHMDRGATDDNACRQVELPIHLGTGT
jgi:hypothetical protein